MKTIAVFLILSLALCGCTPQQIKADVEAKVAHDIAVQISPSAIPDFLKVRDEALAQTPPDTYLAACMNDNVALLQQLVAYQPPGLPGSGAPDANGCKPDEYFDAGTKTCKRGAALTAYQIYLAAHAPPPTLPGIPDALIADCSVPAAKVNMDVLSFLGQFGVSLAQFKFGGVIGSAKTLSLVKAAEAAQAAGAKP